MGHHISKDGIAPKASKIDSIQQEQPSKNQKETRVFLVMTGYFCRFLQNYSVIAKPLYELTKKGKPFTWSKDCKDAFTKLKASFCTAPVLQHINYNKPFILATNTSTKGLGACLSQPDSDGNLKPV